MLLIYPPAARCAEPPLGVARLAAYLRGRGVDLRCLDLCLEGILYLLEQEPEASDTWTRGALKRRGRAADSLREIGCYGNAARYGRAVGDLNRALLAASAGAGAGAEASLADYREKGRSPLARADLEAAARAFRENPFYPLFERRIGPELASSSDSVVGISICYLSQALCAFAVAGYVKATRPGARIVLGGGLVTSWLAGGALAAGETFGGLVEALLPGPGEEGLGALLGLEKAISSPPPDFDDFDLSAYFAPKRILPFNFSSGCPWRRCSFCPEKAEARPYRALPAPAAIEELNALAGRYHPGLFHFTDNEVSPLYLRALADNPPGAPWYGFARFSRSLLDLGFCRALAASGCLMLQLGLESADQGVLDALGKGTRVEEVDRILSNLAQASIGAYVYVLFGTPAEDREAAMRTRDFVAERADEIAFLNVALFNLPASGSEARRLETRGFYEGDLSLYLDFTHPKGWGRAEVRSFLSRDFDSVPEIRAVSRRTPPIFTSSHAPFFL